ncbi:MAG: redoxin domain-containing protein [Azoarcus sp.]|jgi:peroxiredoxin|nr:redoxin domain-containing protein [Azoarcus sp.]
MRRFSFAKLTMTLVFSILAGSAGAAVDIGKPAPAFAGVGADGRPVALADYKGKTVILEWTNHDCPFVKKHYESGNIPNLQKDAAAQGIVWLQVISSAPGKQGYVDGATARQLNERRGASPAGTVLDPDGKIGRLYDARTTPHLYIIDPSGALTYKGGIDSIRSAKQEDIAKADNYIRLALADIAAARPIGQNNTQPYGCTVKYAD